MWGHLDTKVENEGEIMKKIKVVIILVLILSCLNSIFVKNVFAENMEATIKSEEEEILESEDQNEVLESEPEEDIQEESNGINQDEEENINREEEEIVEKESQENVVEEEHEIEIQEGIENSWRYQNGERIYFDSMYQSKGEYKPWSKVNGYYVNNKGEKIAGAIAKGIDVSEWQGSIDWNRVKNSDIDYAIIRCGYGMDLEEQDDKFWTRNADECTRLGIPFGIYLYSYADSVEKAKSEAQHVLRLVKKYKLAYPIYYDLEQADIREKLSGDQITEIAATFCSIIKEAGYRVAIYSNTDWFTNYLTTPFFVDSEKWVAQYNSVCTYNGTYTMWQCSDAGVVDGIEGPVDLNMDFGTVDLKKVIVQEGDKIYG